MSKNFYMKENNLNKKNTYISKDAYIKIVADSWFKVETAIEIVEPLLTYIDIERNIHKKASLLKLSIILVINIFNRTSSVGEL